MAAPQVIWDESRAYGQLKALLVAALPEVDSRDIYRGRPAASPSKYGPTSVVILPLTPAPEYTSLQGATDDSAQQQRWSVQVTTAAAGSWGVSVLGAAGAYVAGGGDSAADIAAGLKAAVDGLGVAVTTQVLATPAAAFGILGDTAGVSLGVTVTPADGGARVLRVVDDNIVRCVYNWGIWRVRLIFRCTPSTVNQAADPGIYDAARYMERVRLWLQASSLPVTNGEAYPYYRDQLQAAPARLSWLSTNTPIVIEEGATAGGTFVRACAIDVAFQTPVGLVHDVPSLDAIGLAAEPVIG